MLTDFARDSLFSTAWFGLMSMVWFGWAQEDPPRSWRVWLGIGSTVGVLVALAFGFLVARSWAEPTALDGRYPLFGVLVAVEVVAAGAGCWLLHMRGADTWMAWWVAVVVAAHFVPLAWLLRDPGMAVVGAVQLLVLVALVGRLRRRGRTTSAPVGAFMGGTLLGSALVAATVALTA